MVDEEIMGRNPLDEDLDSIWKIPKKRPYRPPEASSARPEDAEVFLEAGEGEAWGPVTEAQAAESGDETVAIDFDSAAMADDAVESDFNVVIESMQFVGFKLDSEFFGIDIMNVQEIIRMQETTRVPKTEHFVKGVVNLRGKVIPVISLRARFSIDDSLEKSKDARIIIANTKAGVMGLEVDAVTEILRIAKNVIVPPPPSATRLDSEYITGVGRLDENLLVILNLDRLLAT